MTWDLILLNRERALEVGARGDVVALPLTNKPAYAQGPRRD